MLNEGDPPRQDVLSSGNQDGFQEQLVILNDGLCLPFAVDVWVVPADVHGDVAAKDVCQAKQWLLNVGDVEPGIKLDFLGDEMDVLVAYDVNGLTGCCSQGDVVLDWLHLDVGCKGWWSY